VLAGRVFAAAHTSQSLSLSADQTAWLATTAVRLRVADPTGQTLGSRASQRTS
jgi:hypothetical protein